MAAPFRILLASVLKPVDDPRMAHKLGRSLLKIPGAEVHVAGFKPAYQVKVAGITLHPIFHFQRLSIYRAKASFKLLKLIRKQKPELLIIGTHELLPASLLAKLLFRCKVVYDVRENYYRNIHYTNAFPAWLRMPLAALVRGLEKAESPFIDHYFLAERAYAEELSFLSSKFTVLENKTLMTEPVSAKPRNQSGILQLLYSGTISETYGIFEAIRLTVGLHELNSSVQLLIIGYAPQTEILIKVNEAIRNFPFIRLVGGEKHVSHTEIMTAISEADFGLISYRPNPSTFNCIPTKLYEYLASRLPVISQQHPVWSGLLEKYRAGINIDFDHPEFTEILARLKNVEFYPGGPVKEATWESEEKKLLSLVQQLNPEWTEK